MSPVEGESFDILVGSRLGEGLEASRRLHRQARGSPDNWKSQRGAPRDPISRTCQAGRELQGPVERLEDLMRRCTQRKDAQCGQRHMLAEDIRMAALEALLREEVERRCQLERSRLDTYQKPREEVILYAAARGYVASRLRQVGKSREGGFGQGKGGRAGKGKGEKPTGKRKRGRTRCCQALGQASAQKIQGLGTAGSTNRTKDNRSLLGREKTDRQAWQRRRKERQVQGCWCVCLDSAVDVGSVTGNPSCEHSGPVLTADSTDKHDCWHNRMRQTRTGHVWNHDGTTEERG